MNKKTKNVLLTILELLVSPFTLLFRCNAISNPNKKVNVWLVVALTVVITAIIIFFGYFAEEIFRW